MNHAALATIYVGWVVVDLRMTAFVLGVSLLLATGFLAVFVRGRRWHEYLAYGISLFVVLSVVLTLTFALAFERAPLLVESFFARP